MDDAGVKTIFEKETYKMVWGEMVLLKGVQFGILYKMQGITIIDGCNSSIVLDIGVEEERTPTISRENFRLWHQWIWNIREKGLRLLHGKGMVEGMYNFSMDFYLCENCVYGKQNQVRFPSSEMREEGILKLVQSDVFGPVSIPSLGNLCTMSHL